MNTTYLREDEREWLARADVQGNLSVKQANIIASRLVEERERNARLHDALGNYGQHDFDCILSQWHAGRPTEDGGYETMFGDKWYQSRPVDETPPCTCGLAAALSEQEKP